MVRFCTTCWFRNAAHLPPKLRDVTASLARLVKGYYDMGPCSDRSNSNPRAFRDPSPCIAALHRQPSRPQMKGAVSLCYDFPTLTGRSCLITDGFSQNGPPCFRPTVATLPWIKKHYEMDANLSASHSYTIVNRKTKRGASNSLV